MSERLADLGDFMTRHIGATLFAMACFAVACISIAAAHAQDTIAPPGPLTQPTPVEGGARLNIADLVTVERGAVVTLLLLSGLKVSGRVVNVKDDAVIVLQLSDARFGFYSVAAVAGVEKR